MGGAQSSYIVHAIQLYSDIFTLLHAPDKCKAVYRRICMCVCIFVCGVGEFMSLYWCFLDIVFLTYFGMS